MISNKYIINSVDQTDLTICDITTVLEPSSYTEGGSSVYEFSIGEVTCPTKYFAEASSINFKRSSIYGLGVLWVSLKHFLQRIGIAKFDMYKRM